jgi:hypothetical protein
MGEFRSQWTGIPAIAEVARFAQLPQASGAGVSECYFPAVPKTERGLDCDRGALLRGVFPADPQELRLWLHRFQDSCGATRLTRAFDTSSAGSRVDSVSEGFIAWQYWIFRQCVRKWHDVTTTQQLPAT